MDNILKKISDYAKIRVAGDKQKISIDDMKILAEKSYANGSDFINALRKDNLSFICEIKKASPSKGIISEDFQYKKIAQEYEKYGADCVSCLTEPKYFLGSDKIFEEIRAEIKLPMLRKDFTVDEYQIYQAKFLGANAVLLICSILSADELKKFLKICEEINISALVETHDEQEIIIALNCGAKIIGVNNRNLKNFSVDFNNSTRLREMVPADKIFVSESGVKNSEDIKILKKIGADAVLIGETLMRAEDKQKILAEFKKI